MSLPYLHMPALDLGGIRIQPYGVWMFAGLVAGALTLFRQGRKFGIAASHLGVVIPCALAAAVIGGHLFDVCWYQWDDAREHPRRFIQLFEGQSLFGALFSVAAVTALIASVRRIHAAALADVVALGCLVAITLGRVGCAFVHDHPGLPTDSVFGVDFPAEQLHWSGIDAQPGTVVRVHDVGLEDLLVLLPITIAAFALVRRRLNAGMIATIAAIAYAVPRFCLDFLRLPSTEPVHAGLTLGQWCCLVTIGLGVVALRAIAHKARQSPLPTATARPIVGA